MTELTQRDTTTNISEVISGLSRTTRELYYYIKRNLGRGHGIKRDKTQYIYNTVINMSKRLKVSRHSIYRGMKTLEENGLIYVDRLNKVKKSIYYLTLMNNMIRELNRNRKYLLRSILGSIGEIEKGINMEEQQEEENVKKEVKTDAKNTSREFAERNIEYFKDYESKECIETRRAILREIGAEAYNSWFKECSFKIKTSNDGIDYIEIKGSGFVEREIDSRYGYFLRNPKLGYKKYRILKE